MGLSSDFIISDFVFPERGKTLYREKIFLLTSDIYTNVVIKFKYY